MTRHEAEKVGEAIGKVISWMLWVVIAAAVHSNWGWTGIGVLLASPFVLVLLIRMARGLAGPAKVAEEAGA